MNDLQEKLQAAIDILEKRLHELQLYMVYGVSPGKDSPTNKFFLKELYAAKRTLMFLLGESASRQPNASTDSE